MSRLMQLSRIKAVVMLAALVLSIAVAGPVAPQSLLQGDAAAAQPASETPLDAARRLQQVMGDQLVVHFSNATGTARFVRTADSAAFPLAGGAVSLEDRAYAFFAEYGAVFGVAVPRQELAITRVVNDPAGASVRMAQRYAGLPVFNTAMIVHFNRAGQVTAVNGMFLPALKLPTKPLVDRSAARAEALQAVAAHLDFDLALLHATTPELGVVQTNLVQDIPGRRALAWKLTVTGGADIRQFVYIDAINGGVVEMFEGIHADRERHTYNMLLQSNYDLAVECRGESDPPSLEPDCDNAHTFAGDTYNFFYNGFRRDSYDDQGAPLLSYVHYLSDICPNAFWNGQFMTYCSTFPHDDVAGHQMAHGVTEFSANLIYAYQAGALNESYSDIFGEAIDLLNDSENEPGSRWLIGEGIVPGGLRNMADPSAPPWFNPDSCSSPFYYCGPLDNGGVHYNSGVPNRAFVLMVDGGTQNNITVSGIGLKKAVAVQYRALAHYLIPTSDFVDNYNALLAACEDLSGQPLHDPDPETGGGVMAEQISAADCAQVKNALDAVQMQLPVCTDIVPDPAGPLCLDDMLASRLFFDDHESVNPGWVASLDTSLYTGQSWTRVEGPAASGSYAWRANDELTSCSGEDYTSDLYLTSPQIDLSGSSAPILRFLHDFFTEGGWDGGSVEVNVNGSWVRVEQDDFLLNAYNGEMDTASTAPNWTLLSPQVFTGSAHPGSFADLAYYDSRVDLRRFMADDTDDIVQIRFRFATDYCNGTDIGWYLDDVMVYDCVVPQTRLFPLVARQ